MADDREPIDSEQRAMSDDPLFREPIEVLEFRLAKCNRQMGEPHNAYRLRGLMERKQRLKEVIAARRDEAPPFARQAEAERISKSARIQLAEKVFGKQKKKQKTPWKPFVLSDEALTQLIEAFMPKGWNR